MNMMKFMLLLFSSTAVACSECDLTGKPRWWAMTHEVCVAVGSTYQEDWDITLQATVGRNNCAKDPWDADLCGGQDDEFG